MSHSQGQGSLHWVTLGLRIVYCLGRELAEELGLRVEEGTGQPGNGRARGEQTRQGPPHERPMGLGAAEGRGRSSASHGLQEMCPVAIRASHMFPLHVFLSCGAQGCLLVTLGWAQRALVCAWWDVYMLLHTRVGGEQCSPLCISVFRAWPGDLQVIFHQCSKTGFSLDRKVHATHHILTSEL